MTKKESKALAQEILNYAVSKGFQYPKNRKHFNNVFGRQDYFDGEYEYDAILEFDYMADRSIEFGVGEEDGQLEHFWDYKDYGQMDCDEAEFTACITFYDSMPDEVSIYPIEPDDDEENEDYSWENDDDEVGFYIELPVLSVVDYLPGAINVNAQYVGFKLIPENREYIYTIIDKFVENVGKYQKASKNLQVTDKITEINKDF
jgi:hypothetical protein